MTGGPTAAPSPATRLLRANVGVAAGTLVSRLTGLVRFALLVGIVDKTLADSYNTANNLPNVIYELILGGVLTATLVPLFTEHVERHDDDATSAVVTTSTIALVGLTVVATLAAPLIVRLYTFNAPPGIDPDTFRRVTILLAFCFLPQIFFYGLTALAAALLNARHRFFAAAWAPVVNNVVVIGVLIVLTRVVTETPRDVDLADRSASLLLFLGLGTTAGIVATAIVLVPALAGAGVRLRWRPQWRHPAVRKVVAISGWTVGFVIANQVALYAMTVLAEPGSGGVTAYQAAFILFQMPVGLLTVSVMTTFTPDLARARLRRNKDELLRRLGLGMRSLAVVTLPASAGIVALSKPIVGVVLERGFFDEASATETAAALAAFAAGIFSLSLYLFTLRAFYAHNDTKTPFVLNVFENGVNILVGLALVGRFGVPGLAWSFSIAYAVAAVAAVWVLTIKVRGAPVRRMLAGVPQLVIAAVVTGEVAWLVSQLVAADVAQLLLGTVAGVVTYVVLLRFLRVHDVAALARRVRAVSGGR